MKALVVYYSRTGHTKKVAHAIADTLGCEIEEIVDTQDRSGAMGYILAGRDASMGRPAKIVEPKCDPLKYDIVIVGTPVWAWTVSAPVRAYLAQNAGKIREAAFFSTYGGSGGQKVLEIMGELCGKKPLAGLHLTTADVAQGSYGEKLKEFVRVLTASKPP